MDITGIDAAVKSVNQQTIPEVDKMGRGWIAEIFDGLHSLLDRVQVSFSIGPRKP